MARPKRHITKYSRSDKKKAMCPSIFCIPSRVVWRQFHEMNHKLSIESSLEML